MTPHPARVDALHAPAIDELAARAITAEPGPGHDAAMLEAIRLGADLHDGGWWWEAHEAWEIPWRQWPRDDPRARLVQALVQDAAAWLQLERGRAVGVRRLLARAGRNRERAIAADPVVRTWLGLDHSLRHRTVAAYLESRLVHGGHDPGAFPMLPRRFPMGEVSCGPG